MSPFLPLLLRPLSYLLWSVCSVTSSLLAPRRTWILAIRVPFDFRLFSPSLHIHYRYFITTMASADFSWFVVTTAVPSMRPHGISRHSFLVYLPNLHIRITVTLLDFVTFGPLIRRMRLGIRFLFVRLRFRYCFFSSTPHDVNLASHYGVRRQLRPLRTFTTD